MTTSIVDLVWQWDPYGIADARSETPSEYDDWAQLVEAALRRDESESVLRRILLEKLQAMGLSSYGLDEFVQAIRALRS